MSQLIFEKSESGRTTSSQFPQKNVKMDDISSVFLRKTSLGLPEVSELQVVRHFTNLSQKNFSVDTHFYPLGSCTMKYNPQIMHQLASLSGFLNLHPLSNDHDQQGLLQCLYELQNDLAEITGMVGISLSPMAGAQGEFAGVSMIKAYHDARNDHERVEIIIPDAAHGTNPASAAMCGYDVKEIKTKPDGDIDLEALKVAVGPKTAGIMLTNPSTLGVFERQIKEVANIVHQAGGLLYYDGANLNAILGKVRPGDMGFDVIHLNLHKTFGTPHGGGGPGVGPVAVGQRLVPFLPIPFVIKNGDHFTWSTQKSHPQSIGRLCALKGNVGMMLRAYIYLKLIGKKGLKRVAEFSTLNANYLMKRLKEAGFTIAFPERRAVHEFIVSLEDQHQAYGVSALDYAKRLQDYHAHAPTTYFPSLVPECLLIEPTETECKSDIDTFVDTMIKIKQEAKTNPQLLRDAPQTMPVKRLDNVKAVKELNVVFTKI